MFSAMLNCLGVDMGSSQVRIYQRDKVILEEASTAVVDNISGQVLGFGTEALILYHKEPENNTLEWPVKNGVIADYDMTKAMLRFFLNKALRRSVSRPSLMVAIPTEISSVTRHALVDALIHAGAQGVSFLRRRLRPSGRERICPCLLLFFPLLSAGMCRMQAFTAAAGFWLRRGFPLGAMISTLASAVTSRTGTA